MAQHAPRRGRPTSGRKMILQAAFDAPDAEAIQRIALREGKSLSAIVRDLTLDGLKNSKSAAKK